MSMRGEFLEWSKVYGGEGNEELAFSAGWDAAQKLAVASNSSHNNARDETVRSCAECKVPNRTIESCFFCFLEKYQRTASPVA